MKLFLCSHFSSVGSLIKEEIENKKVAFIPTASLREEMCIRDSLPSDEQWIICF